MPIRENSFVPERIYHIFNKTVDEKKAFASPDSCRHFIQLLQYYRSSNVRVRFSRYRSLPISVRSEIYTEILKPPSFMVNILAFCLMPNHYHLLLKQNSINGISQYMSIVQNAFTRHANIKGSRKGPLFLTQFKAVEVKTDDQLKHVSRYIHLNPNSSHLISSKTNLPKYKYSSYPSYISGSNDSITDDSIVMSLFNNNRSKYEQFVLDNADYQERLENLKHTFKWR